MFQPLDYMFEVLILIMILYGTFQFWNQYVRVKAVKDDLIERYIVLQRIYESRR